MKLGNSSFRNRFDILSEKRPSGLAEPGYKMLWEITIGVMWLVASGSVSVKRIWDIPDDRIFSFVSFYSIRNKL